MELVLLKSYYNCYWKAVPSFQMRLIRSRSMLKLVNLDLADFNTLLWRSKKNPWLGKLGRI